MTTQPSSLTERYGAPRPGLRRTLLAGLVAVVSLALAWLAWSAWFHSTPDVASDIVSFQVVGEHEATARFAVRVSGEDVVGRCTLRAFAEDHTIVGEAVVEVSGPSFVDGRQVEQSIRTERRATAVELLGCTSPGQPRPR